MSVHFSTFQYISVHFGTVQDISVQFSAFQVHISLHFIFSICRYISAYFSTFQYISVHFSTFQYISVQFRTFQYSLVHFKFTSHYISFSVYVGTFQHISVHFSTWSSINFDILPWYVQQIPLLCAIKSWRHQLTHSWFFTWNFSVSVLSVCKIYLLSWISVRQYSWISANIKGLTAHLLPRFTNLFFWYSNVPEGQSLCSVQPHE